MAISAMNICYANRQDTYHVDENGLVTKGAPKSFVSDISFEQFTCRKPTRQETTDHDPRQCSKSARSFFKS